MTILEAYTRVFVERDDLDATIDDYRRLLDGEVSLRFSDPATGLDLAAVTAAAMSVLIVAGDADRRRPFEVTRLTLRVDDLAEMVARLESLGIERLEPIQPTPVGRKTRARHRDGLVVEYVEARGGSGGRP